jgi:hypothetical protein
MTSNLVALIGITFSSRGEKMEHLCRGLTKSRWSQRRLRLPPSLRPTLRSYGAAGRSYGGTGEFMDGLSYTMIIEFTEPLARLSRLSFGAKGDRRGFGSLGDV